MPRRLLVLPILALCTVLISPAYATPDEAAGWVIPDPALDAEVARFTDLEARLAELAAVEARLWEIAVSMLREAVAASWAERDAEAARAAETRERPSSGRETASSGDGSSANPVIPEAVARRESGCTWDAYNDGGCSGRGCIGFYQLDAGHFAADSPWGSGHGSCYGLGDPWDPAVQTACASRLGPSAWASTWGG